MSLLDGMYVMVDHTPPPGNIMLAMVRCHRSFGLREPEIRPWKYLGNPANGMSPRHLVRCACTLDRTYRQVMEITAPLPTGIVLERHMFGNEHLTSLYWVGQCSDCGLVLWMVDHDTRIRWQAALAAWSATGRDATTKPYDPCGALGQKPARNSRDWNAFTRLYDDRTRTLIAPAVVPTFQL